MRRWASNVTLSHLSKLFRQTFSLSLGVMLIYRQNLIYFLFFESLFIFSHFLSFSIGLDMAGGSIGGWSRSELYLLLSINTFSHLIFISFFIAPIFNLSDHIWNGKLDYALMKPLPGPLAIYFTNEFIVSNLPNLLVAGGLLIHFMLENQLASQASTWGLVTMMVILGLCVRVALATFMMVPAFFSERLTDGEGSFWAVSGLARYPTSLFPRAMEYIVTYIIPLGMMAAMPSAILLEKDHSATLIFSVVMSVIFSALAYASLLWGLRNYKSVNAGI